MKILFFLAAWQRPEITEICFMGLNRLKKAGLFQTDTLCVISEDSMKQLCKKYDIDYVVHPNLPLGKKKNFGLNEAFKKDWDYLIELGSDDILKTEILELYKPLLGQRELLTITNLCFVNSQNGDCVNQVSNTSFGLGRAISRTAIERACKGVYVKNLKSFITNGRACKKGEIGFLEKESALSNLSMVEIISEECYRLWGDDLNKCLDNSSNYHLATNGVMDKKVYSDFPLAIDIKSDVNIWAFNPKSGNKYDLELALKGISYKEKEALHGIIRANKVQQSNIAA